VASEYEGLMRRNWIMFPPVTLQALPKSLQRLFGRVPPTMTRSACGELELDAA